MVDALIASLKVAVTVVVALMPVAPLAGEIAVTVGGVVSPGAAVVNDQETLAASAFPATSLARGSVAPPLTVAVYVAEAASALLGVSVATSVEALYVTVAGTSAFDASRNSNVPVPIVVAFIDSLNVAVTTVATLTPVAPLAGDVVVTVGGVVSGPAGVNTTSTQ